MQVLFKDFFYWLAVVICELIELRRINRINPDRIRENSVELYELLNCIIRYCRLRSFNLCRFRFFRHCGITPDI